jgi:hypothetical protein
MITSTVGIGYVFVVYGFLQKKRQPETGSNGGWFCYGTVRDVRIGLYL